MTACKKLGYDGVAYYSKRVSDEAFARAAINWVLFVNYDNEKAGIIKHIKIDDAFNYAVYKNLLLSIKNTSYELRSIKTRYITNIGNYDHQFPYYETDFFKFDQFLFSIWSNKKNGKSKDDIGWGIDLE